MRRVEIEQRLFGKIKAPRRNTLLVLFDEILSEVTSDSGIITPIDSRPPVNVGTVISVGAGCSLRQGDRVLVAKGYGNRVPYENETKSILVLLSENQIECLLTGDAERDDYALETDGLK